MKTIPGKQRSAVKLKGSEEIDVKDFLTNIGSQRSKKIVDPDFAEDNVLEILNHKRRWKNTLSKRTKRMMKIKKIDNGDLRLN